MGKYRTFILELVKNNGILQNEKNSGVRFVLFDYFNVLYQKELKDSEKCYENYFSLVNPFQNESYYKVSSKSLGLYQHEEKLKEKEDPFYVDEGEEYLSDKPFLGIIQISLCRESFSKPWDEIEDFLEYCEQMIEQIADEACNYSQSCLYRSSNTGDFCLIVRTGYVEEIYKTALFLNKFKNVHGEGNGQLQFSTYTSVGIECVAGENGAYCTLSRKFVKAHEDVRFALRLSAGPSLANELNDFKNIKVCKGECTVNKGVFGHYDYLLHIGIEEFAEIYPVLCEKKLGKARFDGVNPDVRDCGIIAGEGKKTDLQKILTETSVRNINERILVDLNSLSIGEGSGQDYAKNITDIQEEVNEKNQSLFERITELKQFRYIFYEEHRTFWDLFRGTKELYKSFSAIGVEEDAYLNWMMFYQDMEVLCHNLEKWIKVAEEKPDNKRLRIWILENWRNNIQAINEYTRLVQNVNYQNYQSPSYEIQTQSDAEKLLVAYRELMEVYFESHKQSENILGKTAECIHPMIYPELSENKVEVTANFLPMEENKDSERVIVCTVPSFEYFGRLYDLLPWIMHESSHNIRVLERKERNSIVLDYSMRQVFQYVTADILVDLSENKLYEGLGSLEDILVDSMLDAVKARYPEDALEKFNFEELVRDMKKFLGEVFAVRRYSSLRGKAVDADKKYQEACGALLNEYRLRCEVDKKIDIFEKLYRKEWDMESVEKIMEDLLQKYWEELAEISIGNMNGEHISIHDFTLFLPSMENKFVDLWEGMKGKGYDYAVKNYIYAVRDLWRIYSTFKRMDKDKEPERRKRFLENTYQYCEKKIKELRENDKDRILEDLTVSQAFREVGLKNLSKKDFQEQMEEKFSRIDGKMILNYHELGIRIYREANADLLMALSLGMTAFGYCRQVFQTISDAKLQPGSYEYGNINYERLRTIAAVLLWKEDSGNELASCGRLKEVYGGKIIEQGKLYCRNTLKCIRDRILMLEEARDKEEDVNSLLAASYGQIEEYLDNLCKENYKEMLICSLITQDGAGLEPKVWEVWNKYSNVLSLCKRYRHLFWRIECFLLGMSDVLKKQKIYVDEKLYEYMKKICVEEEKMGAVDVGCSWEKDLPVYLMETKRKIGDYYNDPEKVYTEKTEQKLENTIDFIQNYYYYNRFRLQGGECDESRGTICGEPATNI